VNTTTSAQIIPTSPVAGGAVVIPQNTPLPIPAGTVTQVVGWPLVAQTNIGNVGFIVPGNFIIPRRGNFTVWASAAFSPTVPIAGTPVTFTLQIYRVNVAAGNAITNIGSQSVVVPVGYTGTSVPISVSGSDLFNANDIVFLAATQDSGAVQTLAAGTRIVISSLPYPKVPPYC